MARGRGTADRSWARNALGVLAAVLVLTLAARLADSSPDLAAPLARLGLDADGARATLGLAAAALASTMGMIMAWVLVAMNMTARRYSLRVVDLFITSWATTPLIALFVATLVAALATQFSVRADRPLTASVLTVAVLASLCLLLVLPYLVSLMHMLGPEYLVTRLRARALAAAHEVAGDGAVGSRREQMLSVLEQTSDVARAAVGAADVELAEVVLYLVRDLLVEYQEVKGRLPASWFAPPAAVFPALPPEQLGEVERERVWLERFVGWELRLLYLAALGRFPEVCSVVGEALKDAAEAARRQGDEAALDLYVRLFNSLLRATINGRDVSAAYNLLQHYRTLGQALLASHPRLAVAIGRHLGYYGREGLAAGMERLWVTAAYDLRLLAAGALARGVAATPLAGLLASSLDDAVAGRPQLAVEAAKCALVFLAAGEGGEPEALAPVRRALAAIGRERVEQAVRELVSVESATFWELTERGVNFDFVPPEHRAALEREARG